MAIELTKETKTKYQASSPVLFAHVSRTTIDGDEKNKLSQKKKESQSQPIVAYVSVHAPLECERKCVCVLVRYVASILVLLK